MANVPGERCRCQDLHNGVDWAIMDACVDHGTGRAAKFLQKAVMLNQDGAIGPCRPSRPLVEGGYAGTMRRENRL